MDQTQIYGKFRGATKHECVRSREISPEGRDSSIDAIYYTAAHATITNEAALSTFYFFNATDAAMSISRKAPCQFGLATVQLYTICHSLTYSHKPLTKQKQPPCQPCPSQPWQSSQCQPRWRKPKPTHASATWGSLCRRWWRTNGRPCWSPTRSPRRW